MNYPIDSSTIAFVAFVSAIVGVCVLAVLFIRSAIGASIVGAASAHARQYAVSYVKGALLMAIASIGAFKETFHAVTEDMTSKWSWFDWVISFSNPVAAAFAVLVAFLDQSTKRATDNPPQQNPTPNP
jgi:hypothetical protein